MLWMYSRLTRALRSHLLLGAHRKCLALDQDQKLGDLVADGSLCAVVETVYALEQFKEAFDQSLKSNRGGKILFKFGATH